MVHIRYINYLVSLFCLSFSEGWDIARPLHIDLLIVMHYLKFLMQVKPALLRLKLTLIGLGVSLAACTALLLAIHSPELRVSLLPGGKEGNINQTWGLAYSDAAARHFEPDAFAAEDDSEASAAMFTICH